MALNIPYLVNQISTFAIWQPSTPLAFVDTSIAPEHLSMPLSHILTKLPLKKIPIHPFELSYPILSIRTIISLILISILTDPMPITLSHSLLEISLIIRSILPYIFSFPMRLAILILTSILISIDEYLYAISMLDELMEITYSYIGCTLIVTLFCHVNAMAVGSVILPLPHVLLSLLVLPKSISLHTSILEITHIVLFIEIEQPMTMRFIVSEIAIVSRLIRKDHISLPHFMIKTKAAFIQIIAINDDPVAMFHVIINPSEVEIILSLEHLIKFLPHQFLSGIIIMMQLVILRLDPIEFKQLTKSNIFFCIESLKRITTFKGHVHNFINYYYKMMMMMMMMMMDG